MDKRNTNRKMECPICLETFVNPKSLPRCLHTFCERCLIKTLSRGKKECPSCRCSLKFKRESQTIEEFVSSIPLNFVVNDLIASFPTTGGRSNLCDCCAEPAMTATSFCEECEEFLCDIHSQSHRLAKRTATHRVHPVEADEKETELANKSILRKTCPRHQGQRQELFCYTCDEAICRDCPLDQHCEHKYRFLAAAGEEQQDLLMNLLKKVAEPLQRLKESHKEVKEDKEKLDRSIKEVKMQIKEGKERLIKALENRTAALMNEVDALGRNEMKKMTSHKGTVKSLKMVAKKAEEMQRNPDPIELLHMKKFLQLTAEQMKDNSFHLPIGFVHLELSLAELLVQCQQFGKVSVCVTKKSVWPSYSPTASRYIPIKPGFCLAVDPRSGNLITAHENKLLVIDSVRGTILREHPVTFDRYRGAAVDPVNGRIFLAALRGNVEVYSEKGKYLQNIGGKDMSAREIALDSQKGHVIIANITMWGLERYSMTDGSLISQMPCSTPSPLGVHFDPQTNHIITTTYQAQVLVFAEDGENVKTIGNQGTEPGELNHPSSVSVDAHGQIIVLDSGNRRVQIFSAEGEFRTIIGEKELSTICDSIAVNPITGSIFVADRGKSQIAVYDTI